MFHKDPKTKGVWICNGCGTTYADENYEKTETIFETITQDVRGLAYILSEVITMDNPPFNTYEEAVRWLLEDTKEYTKERGI